MTKPKNRDDGLQSDFLIGTLKYYFKRGQFS